MHRFFVPASTTPSAEFALPGAESHHAQHVLRVKPGERVVLLNGAGEELLADVTTVTRQEVRVRVVQRTAHKPLACRIQLFQAVPKAKAMEWIVQKATELGAARVVPMLSERTVPVWDDHSAQQKSEKWRSIAVEAAKQCGTPWLPVIDTPLSIDHALPVAQATELNLVASLQPEAKHPRGYFESFRAERGRAPASVSIWVGPEGDFTPAEMNRIRAAGALPISLGPLVLRSETAAIYCLALANYEIQAASPEL